MNGYHEIDGIPCGANRWLLTELLRGEWGFDGIVVSDYFAVRQLDDYHHVAESGPQAAALALTTGIDVELPGTDCYSNDLREALDVRRGHDRRHRPRRRAGADVEVPARPVRASLRRCRRDARPHAAPSPARARRPGRGRQPGAAEERRRAAARAPGIGRRDRSQRRHAIATCSATTPTSPTSSRCSTWRAAAATCSRSRSTSNMTIDDVDDLSHVETVLDALVERLPESAVRYVQGCGVNDDDRSGFAQAVGVAAAGRRRRARDGRQAPGSRPTARRVRHVMWRRSTFPGVQEELVLAVAATGTPVVLVLVAGRPIGSPAVHAAASAVVHGVAAGRARRRRHRRRPVRRRQPRRQAADQLPPQFRADPGVLRPQGLGRALALARRVRRHVEPSRCTRSDTGSRTRRSRSTRSRSAIRSSPPATRSSSRRRSATSAMFAADEVVQVYTRDPVASVTRPVLELQSFARVTLDPVRIDHRRLRDRRRRPRIPRPHRWRTSSRRARSTSSSAARPAS